jgi:hypothetical protein
MTVGWQKLRVPLLERLALADLAQRRGESEEATLARVIREAVQRECLDQRPLGRGGPTTETTLARPGELRA